jgi:hypothetical protein
LQMGFSDKPGVDFFHYLLWWLFCHASFFLSLFNLGEEDNMLYLKKKSWCIFLSDTSLYFGLN